MNKTILTIAIIASLAAGTIFTGCESSQDKLDNAQTEMKEAKNELEQEKNEANIEKEWRKFKTDAQAKIKGNEECIAELKAKKENSGTILDHIRTKMIADLEKQNRDLRLQVDAYKVQLTDLESFKLEVNHGINEIEEGISSLSVDNKN